MYTFWIKIGLGVALILAAFGAVRYYNHIIEIQQKLKDENAQLKQDMKDYQDLKDRYNELEEANSELLEQTDKKNSIVITKHDKVREYLDSPEARSSNRESSEILKETIRRLRNDK